jgi:hypothetical protein
MRGRKRVGIFRRRGKRERARKRVSQTEADVRVLNRVFAAEVYHTLSFMDAEGNLKAVREMLRCVASPALPEDCFFFSRYKNLLLVSVEKKSSPELKTAFGKGSLRAFKPFRSRSFDLVFEGVTTRDVKQEELVDAVSKRLGIESERIANSIEVSRDRGKGKFFFAVSTKEDQEYIRIV